LSACAIPSLGFGPGTPPEPPLAEQQILRLNVAADPETIDPAAVSFTNELAVVMRVFANLLRVDEKGALVPDAAEALPVVSGDGRILTFTLRNGLKYSDGHPLTARDFVFGWRRHLDPRTAGEYAFLGHALEGGEALNAPTTRDPAVLETLRLGLGVRAPNDRMVEFRLIGPAPWFQSALATWCGVPVREDRVTQAGDRWTEPATYIGNGPYVLRKWERQNRMVFEANPLYHAGPPVVRTLEISTISEPSVALAAYRNSELDVVGLQREEMATVLADPELKQQHQRFPGPCTTYLGFNTTRPPFDRADVRRAFSAALDREAYVTEALGGLGAPAGQLVPPRLSGHFAELRTQKKDLAAARKHLSDAGHADPTSLPPVRLVYSGAARGRARVEALAEQLNRGLGVQVITEPAESRTLAGLMRSIETTPQLFVLGWCQDYPDPQSWYSAFLHSRSPTASSGWKHAEFDRLIETADVDGDPNRRVDTYKRAAQIAIDEAPVAFLYHSVIARLVKPWVAGLGENPLEHFEGQASLHRLRILKH
ncbi:MAG TPA: peptide ABC transporter substrate-binding protein, partial [Chloroflexota bacterium]|nr:peptide ABC transporter substrate-binding protein [Chloroflexota bacterium]